MNEREWLFAMVWTLSNENREVKMQVVTLERELEKALEDSESSRALMDSVRDYLGG